MRSASPGGGAALAGLLALMATAGAQELSLTSFSHRGTLKWSYPTNRIIEYRLQGATDPGDQNWSDIGCTLSPTGTVMTAPVPMAFRVKARLMVPESMVLIPGGVISGTNPLAPLETTNTWYPETYSHTVDSFYMDRYEVTRALWFEVRDWAVSNSYYIYVPPGLPDKPLNHPMIEVFFYDCVKWCNARSEKAGLDPVYYTNASLTAVFRSVWCTNLYVDESANGYRLPTDEEFQYAARGGLQSQRFPWGDEIQHARANYYSTNVYPYDTSPTRGLHPGTSEPSPPTLPVGSFAPNAYGLYDMAGNVSERVYTFIPGTGTRLHSVRGGSCVDRAELLRVGHMTSGDAYTADMDTGFRTVRSVP
ncbi:MAG: SUMF1/EgtB/PvdO family nonheme iron enzyme [Kiritimatiellae bacterium]|nr:SUMF1/EgtB/PvdO family nonheme iron enzyme [Kiritimatiellia bacterium]